MIKEEKIPTKPETINQADLLAKLQTRFDKPVKPRGSTDNAYDEDPD